jgi:hypothetical protein
MKWYEPSLPSADGKAFAFAGHARNIGANTHGRLPLDRIVIRLAQRIQSAMIERQIKWRSLSAWAFALLALLAFSSCLEA